MTNQKPFPNQRLDWRQNSGDPDNVLTSPVSMGNISKDRVNSDEKSSETKLKEASSRIKTSNPFICDALDEDTDEIRAV